MCVRLRGKRPKTCDEVLKFKIKIISHLWSYVWYGLNTAGTGVRSSNGRYSNRDRQFIALT